MIVRLAKYASDVERKNENEISSNFKRVNCFYYFFFFFDFTVCINQRSTITEFAKTKEFRY